MLKGAVKECASCSNVWGTMESWWERASTPGKPDAAKRVSQNLSLPVFHENNGPASRGWSLSCIILAP